ncbi:MULTISPECIES: DUF2894 domain-containing protein [unclassified Roseateles]|uniref:DUF2894 domain-containing protein n=1 Tax=unclassified Roseateles TaxID=2626991 RepID=UPI0006F8725B|nr:MULTISPECIES: DUF2894 domain-containing protein [unclassified Roseateles]KQW45683.1 hypothetical protein ASC81_12390 [Pelomonas sp. Root405]KRA72527.1 hypothetical protein ASD88_12390 [Pelomonas sp. Root662]
MNAHDDPQAWLQAQPTSDPVSRRVLEGLARRAARQPQGALRERLVARLVERAQAQASTPAAAPRAPASGGPLAELTARLDVGAGPELRNVHLHRRTWSALRLTRRMAEVSAPVPEHLGPLNSQVLVTRALQQLRDLSPDYLQRLLIQLDTLAALAPLQLAPEAEKPARPAGRKPAGPRKR